MTPHQVLPRMKFVDYTMTDPGNAGTIVPDRQFAVVRLISAGAETRTVAAPTKAGLIFTLDHVTDAGDITVTFTGGWNEAGTTTKVFSAIGQFATMISIEQTAGTYVWRQLASDSTQAALTAQHATLTQAGTDSGDVAIQALTSSTPFGFANAAEGEAVIACVLNAMVRLAEIESRLEVAGIVLAN